MRARLSRLDRGVDCLARYFSAGVAGRESPGDALGVVLDLHDDLVLLDEFPSPRARSACWVHDDGRWSDGQALVPGKPDWRGPDEVLARRCCGPDLIDRSARSSPLPPGVTRSCADTLASPGPARRNPERPPPLADILERLGPGRLDEVSRELRNPCRRHLRSRWCGRLGSVLLGERDRHDADVLAQLEPLSPLRLPIRKQRRVASEIASLDCLPCLLGGQQSIDPADQ